MKRHPGFQFLVLAVVCAALAGAARASSYTVGPIQWEGLCQEHFPRDATDYGMQADLEATYAAGSDFFLYSDSYCGHVSGWASSPSVVATASMWAYLECGEEEVATTVVGQVIGGGCSYVAGPNGAVVIPETVLYLGDEYMEVATGVGSFGVDHISSPMFAVHFDVNNSLDLDMPLSTPL